MTQGRCCQAHAQPVTRLAVQRQALLYQAPRPDLVTTREVDKARPAQGQGALARGQPVTLGQDLVDIASQFPGVAVQPPEPPRRPDQVERLFRLAALQKP